MKAAINNLRNKNITGFYQQRNISYSHRINHACIVTIALSASPLIFHVLGILMRSRNRFKVNYSIYAYPYVLYFIIIILLLLRSYTDFNGHCQSFLKINTASCKFTQQYFETRLPVGRKIMQISDNNNLKILGNVNIVSIHFS